MRFEVAILLITASYGPRTNPVPSRRPLPGRSTRAAASSGAQRQPSGSRASSTSSSTSLSRSTFASSFWKARWFRGAWEKPLRDHLLGGQLIREGWLDEAGVQALIDQHVGMKADTSYSLFALLMLELWLAGSEAV